MRYNTNAVTGNKNDVEGMASEQSFNLIASDF